MRLLLEVPATYVCTLLTDDTLQRELDWTAARTMYRGIAAAA